MKLETVADYEGLILQTIESDIYSILQGTDLPYLGYHYTDEVTQPERRRYVDGYRILISRRAEHDLVRTVYELAHECIHLIAPIDPVGVNYFEEGLAINFQMEFAKKFSFGTFDGTPYHEAALERHLRSFTYTREANDKIDTLHYEEIGIYSGPPIPYLIVGFKTIKNKIMYRVVCSLLIFICYSCGDSNPKSSDNEKILKSTYYRNSGRIVESYSINDSLFGLSYEFDINGNLLCVCDFQADSNLNNFLFVKNGRLDTAHSMAASVCNLDTFYDKNSGSHTIIFDLTYFGQSFDTTHFVNLTDPQFKFTDLDTLDSSRPYPVFPTA